MNKLQRTVFIIFILSCLLMIILISIPSAKYINGLNAQIEHWTERVQYFTQNFDEQQYRNAQQQLSSYKSTLFTFSGDLPSIYITVLGFFIFIWALIVANFTKLTDSN